MDLFVQFLLLPLSYLFSISSLRSHKCLLLSRLTATRSPQKMTQVNLKVKYPVSPWQVYSVKNVSVVVTLLALKVQHTQVLFR